MEITCDSCQTKLKIADEKIPLDRTATFACPKCKGKVTIRPDKGADAAAVVEESAGLGAELGFEEESFDTGENAAEARPFQFIEEEGKIALVCEADPVIRKSATDILTLMEYHVSSVQDNREALKNMRYQNYDVVVVNETFGTDNPDMNGILIYLERLQMEVRRNMFVAMISERYRTMDYMMAYNKSVNLIINKKNAADLDKILAKGLSDYDMFYRIFKETVQ